MMQRGQQGVVLVCLLRQQGSITFYGCVHICLSRKVSRQRYQAFTTSLSRSRLVSGRLVEMVCVLFCCFRVGWGESASTTSSELRLLERRAVTIVGSRLAMAAPFRQSLGVVAGGMTFILHLSLSLIPSFLSSGGQV